MKTQKLGSKGPDISVVGYGAWELGGMWGSNPPEDEMIDAMRAGFDAGMTWLDTAEVYGDGTSEELCARAIQGYDDVLVFTKVAPKPNGSGFDREGVRNGCEKSLKRLGRDVIDLYQCHWPDESVPLEETWEAMASLIDDGRVRWIGVSNFDVGQIRRCEAIRHVDSLQPQFSMLRREAAEELLPLCAENGTGVIAYGPLAFGLLTGTITPDTKFEENDWRRNPEMRAWEKLFKPGVREKHLAVVDALHPIAQRKGISLAELALAWVFHQHGVTAAIAGSRRKNHTVENARAGDVELSKQDVADIGEILAGAETSP